MQNKYNYGYANIRGFKMHKNTIRNTITGIIGGILLSTGVANGQVDSTNNKNQIKTGLENTIADKTKNDRAFEYPHQSQKNTIYVGSAIWGVLPTVIIADGQEYDFKIPTGKKYIPEDFPLQIKLYSIDELEKKVKKFTDLNKKQPKTSLQDKLERDEVATQKIENYSGHHIDLSKDTTIVKLVKQYLSNLIIDAKESRLLAREVASKGWVKAGIGVSIYHKGNTINGNIVNGESVPIILDIAAHVIDAEDARTDTVYLSEKAKKEAKETPSGITNITITNNNYYGDTPKTQKNITPIVKKDTVPQVEKNTIQFFVGGGASRNSYINNTRFENNVLNQQHKSNEIIGQYTAGIKFPKWSVAALFGYNNNVEKNIEDHHLSAIKNAETLFQTNIKYNIIQPGLDVEFFPIKKLGIGIGLQYNIIKTDTSGTVYQSVTDEIGHMKALLLPLDEKTGKIEFFSVTPKVELKLNKFAIYAGGKFALKPEYRNYDAIVAGLKIYIGK